MRIIGICVFRLGMSYIFYLYYFGGFLILECPYEGMLSIMTTIGDFF